MHFYGLNEYVTCILNINLLTALKHTTGTYILNGNWTNSWPGDYEGAGTVFTYRKENGNFGEVIFAPGPLTESVELIVISTLK